MPSRRAFVKVGVLPGFGLAHLLAGESVGADHKPPAGHSAKHCIFVFNYGGPSHIDTFDPKPDAPPEFRGEFGVIPTRVAGIRFTEHVPRLAAIAEKFALVRSVSHRMLDHRQGGYYTLTGTAPVRRRPPTAEDFPNPGSVLAYLRPSNRSLPVSVTLPNGLHDNFVPVRGVGAGFLGTRFDPFRMFADPNSSQFHVDILRLQQGVNDGRFRSRENLLSIVDVNGQVPNGWQPDRAFDVSRERAFGLLASEAARKAFDVGREPVAVRERYGRTKYGQCLLLARRLIEAGTRLVTVLGGGPYPMDVWDTHQRNFTRLKGELLPPADQALSALIVDLEERGMLEETLVVWLGEFGRTPRIGATTVSSMNKPDGRDHWPHCYSVLLSGGGVRGGLVHGASDRLAAYPVDGQVAPEDVIATVYSSLGFSPETLVPDHLNRHVPISAGKPISAVF